MSKKKYVIETAFENMDIQEIMQLGLDDNGRIINWTDSIEDVEELNSDYINEHYVELKDEAYQAGLNDGSLDVKQRVEGAYQRGLEDAWEAAKRIFGYEIDGAVPIADIGNVFGYEPCKAFCTADILRDFTVQEAIAKIKAYDNATPSDRIEVGDIVDVYGNLGVVTYMYELKACVMMVEDGSSGDWNLNELKKTGKHYDIASILEAMRTHDR